MLAACFKVGRFELDKKFSELVGCLVSDSDSNLSHSIGDHNTDTAGSVGPDPGNLKGVANHTHTHYTCCSSDNFIPKLGKIHHNDGCKMLLSIIS